MGLVASGMLDTLSVVHAFTCQSQQMLLQVDYSLWYSLLVVKLVLAFQA